MLCYSQQLTNALSLTFSLTFYSRSVGYFRRLLFYTRDNYPFDILNNYFLFYF